MDTNPSTISKFKTKHNNNSLPDIRFREFNIIREFYGL